MWVETQPSAQTSFQKLNIDNSCRRKAQLDITFLKSCPILLYFFTLCQIFCPGLQPNHENKQERPRKTNN